MARYRKIHVPMYADSKFKSLSKPQPNGQTLWIYILTGPHTSIIPGLSCIGEAALAESLEWSPEDFREAFLEISKRSMAKADWKARIVWVPNAVKYNPPESPNVIKAWSSFWDEVPECQLKAVIYKELKDFVDGMGKGFQETFRKAFGKPFGKAMPNQEQEQEQEQDNIPADKSAGVGNGKVKPHSSQPTKREPAAKPTSDHAAFVEYFVTRWQDQYGAKYVFQAKDGAAGSKVLKAARNLERARLLVDIFLADAAKWIAEQRHPLPLLLNQINKYIPQLDGNTILPKADPDNFVAVHPDVADLPWNRRDE